MEISNFNTSFTIVLAAKGRVLNFVKMNATTLYVEACKCMLSLENGSQAVWDQLFHLLPKLRQALSCRVCRRLCIDPHGSHSCEHHVCKGCLRKKRSLNPGCRWCTNLEKLTEDKQTRIVLACYQKLCEYIAQNAPGVQRLAIATQNGEYNKTLAIIQEAVTSPISLVHCQNQQSQQVPVNCPARESNSTISSSSGSGNFNMASKSRDITEAKLPPEIQALASPKLNVAKLLAPQPTENGNQIQKKKKRKPFKGTYYNYGKKKKTAVRLSVSAPNLSCSTQMTSIVEMNMDSLHFATSNCQQENVNEKEEENKEILVVDSPDQPELKPELQKEPTVITPPGKKKRSRGKLKRCSCGMTSKLQSKRCMSTRCPCFSDKGSCDCCPCLNCGNPFNNNNDKLLPDEGYKLRFVDEKNMLTSKE